ncbi:uncharacterized protein LOC126802753 [Argentina anserina]|uniref:uncharacterized protein LOC126802753 n=1 Tax=Argentina anserina TaxID=57926 RepID=UPI002176221F|nr:uncharacterized protein LOC126802753 [Potentilla anserina]
MIVQNDMVSVNETFASSSMLPHDETSPSHNGEDLVKLHNVDVLAIYEHRVQFHKASNTLRNLAFNDFRIEEASGFSGGIWLYWNNLRTNVTFLASNFQSIYVKISIPSKNAWMLYVVYASPTHTSRAGLWRYFESLADQFKLPTMFISDFNEFLSAADKNSRPLTGRFGGLRYWINIVALINMSFSSSCYTWSNNKVKKRLDRAFCDIDWRFSYHDAFIHHLPKIKSDHCPILMQLTSNNFVNGRVTPFKIQAMWFSHGDYSDFISSTWNSLNGDFSSEIKDLSSALSTWNKEIFGHLFHRKKKILTRIGGIQKARDKHENSFLTNLEADLIKEYETIRD